ncbi:MAG: ribonuclease III domain-containing protein [Oscillospiraceae bacterium]
METNPKNLSPLTLAFLGDAVFGLLVREKLVLFANRPVSQLHTLSVRSVNASSQAKAAKMLMPILTEEELDVLKRGRNAHSNHTPKNQSEGDYHYATGLESLFGYLHLMGKADRLRELFDIIYEDEAKISEKG